MAWRHAMRAGVTAVVLAGFGTILCAQPGAAGARSRVRSARHGNTRSLHVTTQDTSATLRLALNIPSFRLDVFERDVLHHSYSVATGMPRYRTPTGTSQIDYVVWNPWWHPPASAWAKHERPHPPGWKNPVGRVKLHVSELIFLHGSPFESSMGSAASHACVRLRNADVRARPPGACARRAAAVGRAA